MDIIYDLIDLLILSYLLSVGVFSYILQQTVFQWRYSHNNSTQH